MVSVISNLNRVGCVGIIIQQVPFLIFIPRVIVALILFMVDNSLIGLVPNKKH